MNPTLSVKIRDLAPKKEFYIFDKKIKVWQNCYMESSTIMLWKKESVSHRSQWATLRGGSNRWRTDSTKHTERLRQLRATYDARALLSFLGTGHSIVRSDLDEHSQDDRLTGQDSFLQCVSCSCLQRRWNHGVQQSSVGVQSVLL